jgi:hypothetical protein
MIDLIEGEVLEHFLLIAEDGSVVPASTCRLVDTRTLSEDDSYTLDQGNDNFNWQVACQSGRLITGFQLL